MSRSPRWITSAVPLDSHRSASDMSSRCSSATTFTAAKINYYSQGYKAAARLQCRVPSQRPPSANVQPRFPLDALLTAAPSAAVSCLPRVYIPAAPPKSSHTPLVPPSPIRLARCARRAGKHDGMRAVTSTATGARRALPFVVRNKHSSDMRRAAGDMMPSRCLLLRDSMCLCFFRCCCNAAIASNRTSLHQALL